MPPTRNTARAALIGVVSCVLLTSFAIVFVDRAAATWAHEHLARPQLLVGLTHMVDPLQAAAALGLLGAAAAAAFGGWRPGQRGRVVIAACLAIIVSVAIKDQLKFVFGRTWPDTWVENNPSWIRDHVFGFNFFHGGRGWASFPSGHTTQIAALASVLWLAYPQLRRLCVTLVALVAIGLWGANFHFVGDIVAGAYLGTACGIGVYALVCRRES